MTIATSTTANARNSRQSQQKYQNNTQPKRRRRRLRYRRTATIKQAGAGKHHEPMRGRSDGEANACVRDAKRKSRERDERKNENLWRSTHWLTSFPSWCCCAAAVLDNNNLKQDEWATTGVERVWKQGGLSSPALLYQLSSAAAPERLACRLNDTLRLRLSSSSSSGPAESTKQHKPLAIDPPPTRRAVRSLPCHDS